MDYYKTPNGTNRLFLYKNELPVTYTRKSLVFSFLNILSMWGGCDKNEIEYMSWEFEECVHESIIKRALSRLDCNLK